MSDGWAVEVKTKLLGGSGESTETYYARVPAQGDAEAAVKKHVRATPDVAVTAKAPITAKMFDGMKIPPGEIGQWQDPA